MHSQDEGFRDEKAFLIDEVWMASSYSPPPHFFLISHSRRLLSLFLASPSSLFFPSSLLLLTSSPCNTSTSRHLLSPLPHPPPYPCSRLSHPSGAKATSRAAAGTRRVIARPARERERTRWRKRERESKTERASEHRFRAGARPSLAVTPLGLRHPSRKPPAPPLRDDGKA